MHIEVSNTFTPHPSSLIQVRICFVIYERIRLISESSGVTKVNTEHIFISHSWTYDNQYRNLTAILDNRKYFSYKDYSVPKDDPIHTNGSDQELYEAIERKIRCCGSVIILAGVYSTHSKWINKEIEIAKKLGKPIIDRKSVV